VKPQTRFEDLLQQYEVVIKDGAAPAACQTIPLRFLSIVTGVLKHKEHEEPRSDANSAQASSYQSTLNLEP